MKNLLLWSSLFVASAASTIILLMPARPVENRTVTTLQAIQNIGFHFDLAADSDASEFATSLKNETNSSVINRQIAAFLKERSNNTRPLNISSNGMLQDGWGTPLFFAMTNSSIYQNVNSSISNERRPFVVWSAGRNQTNEFGFSDDVFK